MKLILSSCDFRNENSSNCIYDNLPKPIGDCKVLFFPNEKSNEELINSQMYHYRLTEFGFKKENVYVFNYWNPEHFFDLDVDVIYISGGNTFGTIKRIRESGADKLIISLVKNGVVYIGGSAGAHIVTPDITHVQKYDTNTFGLCDFSGLGLCDMVLICHYNDDRENDYLELKSSSKYEVTALTNDEYLVVTSEQLAPSAE